MSYKVLSQIRANKTLYTVGESFPNKLPKVDYEDLLSKGYLEEVNTKQASTSTSTTTTSNNVQIPAQNTQKIKSEK